MTISTWPVTGAGMSDTEWSRLASTFAFSGVLGGVNGIGFEPYLTPGVGLFARPGAAVSRGVYITSDTDVQASIPQNAGGSNRLDLWTLRADIAVSPVPTFTYVTGGSSYPTVQRDTDGIFDVPIARAVVPSGSTVPSSIASARMWVAAAVMPVASVSDVPAAELRPGIIAVGHWGAAMWNGSSWRYLLDEATGTISLGAGWSSWGGSYKAPSWRRDRSRVYLSGTIKRTGGAVSVGPNDDTFRFTVELPTSYRPNGRRLMAATAGGNLTDAVAGRVIYKPGGGLYYQPGPTSVTFAQNAGYIALDGLSYDLD